MKDRIADRLGDYADLGEKEGFILAAEAHCGAAVDRSERARWVINTVTGGVCVEQIFGKGG